MITRLTLGLMLSACAPSLAVLGPDFTPRARLVGAGHAWHLVVDGVAGPPFAGIALDEVRFAAAAPHVAYPAMPCRWLDGRCHTGQGWVVVKDHSVGRAWESVSFVTLSSDGERLAYVAALGERSLVVADERPIGAWDAVGPLTFDATGRLIHAAHLGRSSLVVIDGRAGPAWPSIDGLIVRGAHFAYAARDDSGERIVRDGVAGPVFERVAAPTLSDDGGRLAYGARVDGKWHVHVEGAADRAFEHVGLPVLAGPHWGYVARDSGRRHVVVDGVARSAWADASDLALSSSGRHAHLAWRDRQRIVVSDVSEHALELAVDGTLTFSSDGRRWGCIAGSLRDRQLFVLAEGDPPAVLAHTSFPALLAITNTAAPTVTDGDAAIRRWVRAQLDREATL